MRRDSICLIPSLVLSVALLGGCKSNAERADELYASALTASAPSEAIALLQEAIGLNPRLEGAHRELANVQFGQANFPAAIDAASAALALQETAEARAIRGQSHFAQESWEPARADLQRAQEIDMTRTDLMMPLGVAHRELGQTEAALGMFERLLEADPDDRAAALEIAEIELDQATELVAPEELNEEIRTQVRSLLTHASTLAPESIVGPGEAVADAERWVFEGEPG
ncbi:MAG: tetratricopeptide repeat protein, partial [Myxococcota bacterium]